MKTKILIDTDILIDISRGIITAIERIKQEELSYELSISLITKMELIIGCRNKREVEQLNEFFRRFYLINIDNNISNKASELIAKYYLSHGLLMADAFIAATAISFNLPLLSKNQKYYRFIPELNLLPYP